MILLLSQEGMEVDDEVVATATNVTAGSPNVVSSPSARSMLVRVSYIFFFFSFNICHLVKRRVQDLEQRFERFNIQEESRASQKEASNALAPHRANGFVFLSFGPLPW